MLRHIAAFEVRYQIRSPLFAVSFALFFLFAFGATTSDQLQIGSRGNVNLNSPYAILQMIGILSVFAIFIVTAFVANVVLRDDETGFAPILRSTRVGKFDYLCGRFVGAFGVAALVLCAVPLAILIGSFMPWLDAEKLGPLVIGHYFYAMLVFGLPTLLVTGAGFFALATVTRSMVWTYVGVIAFLVLFVVARILLRDPAYAEAAALLDPFGIGALNRSTRYWTAADRNTLLPPIEGLLLYNRLIWLALGAALLALAYRLFRFEARVRTPAPAPAKHAADVPPTVRALAAASHNRAARWLQLRALTRFDMAFVFRSPAFLVLLGLGIFNSFGALFSVVDVRGERYLPVTRAVVDALSSSFSLIPAIIAIFYAGELVWRDRERRMHEIVDASAAPNWAFLLPKVLAITLVLLATLVAAAVFGMLFQLYHAYTQLEPESMLLWFVLPGLISALLLAVLSVFVQALVPYKAAGWAVMLVYIAASTTLDMLGFEHKLYSYAESAAVPLSDMNAMGHFWIGRAWHQAYWLAFGLMLLVCTHLLWRRGAETRLRPRLARVGARLRGAPGLLLGLAMLAWIGTGSWIFYNANVLNPYETQTEREQLQADYERTLLPFENLPQPTVTHVDLKVELFPRLIRADAQGSYALENRSGQPLDRVDVEVDRNLKLLRLELEGAQLEERYDRFGHRTFRLLTAMQPGERRTLHFATRLEQRGFVNGRPLTRIVGNGSFLNNFELAPLLGVDRHAVLQDRAKRRKYGLPGEMRPAKLEDEGASAHHYLRRDSDWVTADISLTTDADQTPLAPGYTVSDTTADGRRTLITRTEAPIHNFFSLQSARYDIRRDRWLGKDGRAVELSVYFHPQHGANVQRMLDAMKASLALFSAEFSSYQFRQARVLEFPAYAGFAQSFANTIPYSESLGFIQNFRDEDRDEKIDMVTYITAHEIAHQWWAHQVIGADKQGMRLLSETFAQYSALLVMEKLYGREQIRRFLKSELDSYLRRRGSEAVEELPLNRVENQPYIHYQKGALAMYWLKEVVGEGRVNRALQRLIERYAFKAAPYPSSEDFLSLLREEAGPQHAPLIADLFERITLYDLKATDAKASKRPDGRFDLRFTVEAKKLYADGRGKETESALDEGFDIGVFTDEPGKKGYSRASVLLMERRALRSGKQSIALVLDRAPKFVGVDPYNMRIDRNSDDNLVKVDMD